MCHLYHLLCECLCMRSWVNFIYCQFKSIKNIFRLRLLMCNVMCIVLHSTLLPQNKPKTQRWIDNVAEIEPIWTVHAQDWSHDIPLIDVSQTKTNSPISNSLDTIRLLARHRTERKIAFNLILRYGLYDLLIIRRIETFRPQCMQWIHHNTLLFIGVYRMYVHCMFISMCVSVLFVLSFFVICVFFLLLVLLSFVTFVSCSRARFLAL